MNSSAKPNFTAWFVMQGTIAAMRHPDFASPANDGLLALYAPLSKRAASTRLLSRIICGMPPGWQYRIGELVTNRGRLRHFYFRKKEILKHTRALLFGEAITQVVVLGAGLDVLSLQLAGNHKEVRFLEIDTRESQAFKMTALAGKLPGNVEFIAGDLRDPLQQILAQSPNFDPAAKTLWIAEGFLMFVPEESAISLFEQMKRQSAKGSYCIFTTLSWKSQGSRFARTLQRFYLKKEQSSFSWAIGFEAVAGFMERLGYAMIQQVSYHALHNGYSDQKFDMDHQIGEDIHIVKMVN